MSRLSILPEALRAVLGGMVVGIALVVLLALAIGAFDALPDQEKGKNVVAIVGSITTVLGTIVGAYVGARVGASAASETARATSADRQAETIRSQELLAQMSAGEAGEALKRADERVKEMGLGGR